MNKNSGDQRPVGLIFRCMRILAVSSLIMTVLLWYGSYSNYEMRFIPGSYKWSVSAYFREGVVSLLLFYHDMPWMKSAQDRRSICEFKKTQVPVRGWPVLIRFTPSKEAGWAGTTHYKLWIDALGSFLFFALGILPVAVLIIFPAIRKHGGVESSILETDSVQDSE